MSRVALAFALWLCAAMAAFAQNPGNLPIVGVLRVNTADTVETTATGFKEALAALGLVDGRNIRLEVRLADGHAERLPDLAQSLVQAKASVIVVFGAPAIRAVQRATSTIPIVAFGELLSEGLIGSLARPGGNTTGVSILNTDVRDPADLPPAFAACRASGAEAINVLTSPMLFSARAEVGRLSLTHKLPAICEWREMAEVGCLASYGTRLSEGWAMLAALTDKMLKGAPPGETPAQQPTKFELGINLNVARVIGIDIPQAVLGIADEVIE